MQATDQAGHAQAGHTKPWRAKSGVQMIFFKPPLIVQQADDNKTQSRAKYLPCFPTEAQKGHAQLDQTLAGYTQPEYNRLGGLEIDRIADGIGSSYLDLAGLVPKLKK